MAGPKAVDFDMHREGALCFSLHKIQHRGGKMSSYVKARPTPADVVAADAVQLLGALDSRQWAALQSLAVAHVRGSMSVQAWRSASSAVVVDAWQRVQNEGRIDFGAVASG
jgi:hypothetical protein